MDTLQTPGTGGLFGAQAPSLTQLAALLSSMSSTKQTQAPGLNIPQDGLQNIPQAPQSDGPNALGQSIEGWLGGLMGGSGQGGSNSLNQGLAFAAAPPEAIGPFAASSPLTALGTGTGIAAQGGSNLSMIAPLLSAFL
jgi:hypothetical protein